MLSTNVVGRDSKQHLRSFSRRSDTLDNANGNADGTVTFKPYDSQNT